jgi:hypothetical protein
MSVIGNARGPAVPAQDSSANNNAYDVIGNKLDTHQGDSISADVHRVDEHLHSASKVYPTLADGVTLTAVNGAGTWTLGSLVEVVPASTITNDFDIHFISIEDISANGVYEIVLYAGASDVEVARVRVTRTAIQDSTLNVPVQTTLIAANSRIRAAVASAADNGETIDISIFYHLY